MSLLLLSAGAGLLIAVLSAASPLTICVVAALPAFFHFSGRGLPADERRILFALLGAALAVRVVVIIGMFVAGLPHFNDLAIGALSGDESYNLARALRTRDIRLGLAQSFYDYFVSIEDYGRTLYVWLIGWIQIAFGPTPYSLRLLNAMLFLGGAMLLYRLVRNAFGPIPALTGLAAVLFIPSLLVSSVSLLKDSLYFLVTSVALTAAVRVVRSRRAITIASGLALTIASLWVLNDLRRGAAVLAVAGFAVAFLLRAVLGDWRRLAAVTGVVVVAAVIAAQNPELRARASDSVRFVARTHAGHVFTVGHAYKLLDEGFYVTPSTGLDWQLTDAQALRFLVRSAISFVVTPLPWQIATRSELVFLPEHMLWLVLIALVPFGLAAGWKRDPLIAALLVGYVLPTAAALALTNGNVGTLLRLRGLVLPFLVWLSALGALWLVQVLIAERYRLGSAGTPVLASEGSLS